MTVDKLKQGVAQLLTPEAVASGLSALVLLLVGLALARGLGRIAYSLVLRSGSPERAHLARRVVFWGLAALVIATALDQLGVDLTLLAGAAGVLTVAVGFASQTSASNIISGLFLIAERPFTVGDVVEINGRTGEVLSVDLLSTKVRTFDNLFIRVPNESVMKGQIVNLSRFAIRRVDIALSVAYGTDPDAVRALLLAKVDAVPEVLDEPRPELRVGALSASGIDLTLVAWTRRENILSLKNALFALILRELAAADIEIPFTQVVVHRPGGAEPEDGDAASVVAAPAQPAG